MHYYHQPLSSSCLSGGFLSQLQEAPNRPKKGNSKKDIQVIPLGVAFYFSALASPPLLSYDQGLGAVPGFCQGEPCPGEEGGMVA